MITEKEFENLFKTNYKRFVSVSYSYTKKRDLAEEVVQDVFVNFWEKTQQGVNILNNEAYIRKAIVYRSISVTKKEKKYSDNEDLKAFELLSISQKNDPETAIINQEKIEQLQDHINSLPDKTRHVFMLSRFEKMSYNEISENTGIKIKTIEYHISKALQYLRKAIYSLAFLLISLL